MGLSDRAKRLCLVLAATLCIVCSLGSFPLAAYAKESTIDVMGNVYEFAKDAHYEFSTAGASSPANTKNTFGTLHISGEVRDTGNINGIPAYSVSSGNISLFYTFDQARLAAEESEWHLIDDKTKRVDAITLSENVLSGAIIVQSSLDGETWITDVTKTDALTTNTDLSAPIYTTKEVQIENGFYYRVIVAYKMKIKTGENKFGPITTDITEEKKVTEVYQFYAASSATPGKTTSAADSPRKELGKKVNTGKDNGYSGSNAVNKDEPHYGWDLGTFVVNGFTRETIDNGTPVFLKNVGDKVTLWFTLKQDINSLNGDSTLTIAEDTNGYDQYFEVRQTNFKHGALIIRYTDHQGTAHAPVVYTDFLAANAKIGVDTRVQLFEEGDYEVALDYEIKSNPLKVGSVSVIPTYTNYKITLRFSIRNGNSMVFPFHIVTGAELSDNAITANGFKIDMAKSRYLTIDVTRSILKVGSDGLITEDVRFNRPAKDSDSYTDEGIYTFTVKNLYTDGNPTTKTIYVGTDKYLLALSQNKLTVKTLNEKIAQGAVINDDGSIAVPVPTTRPVTITETKGTTAVPTEIKASETIKTVAEETKATATESPASDNGKSSSVNSKAIDMIKNIPPLIFMILGSVVAGGIVVSLLMKKRNGKREDGAK